MTDFASATSARDLLEHDTFVRAVARGLLHDAHAAEDVAQDVHLKRIEGRESRLGSVRGWIATVARNAARDARRQGARREARERRVARAEAQESVDVAFERLSIQREVVGAILKLDDPYRTVVLLRYYHDLEPTAIAAKLGVKAATVRTQLVRAHELLRNKLDAHRERRAWAALLLPDQASASAQGLPWMAVGTAIVVVVGTCAWIATRGGAADPSGVELAAEEVRSSAPERLELSAAVVESPSSREAIVPAEVPVAQPASEPAKAVLLDRAELFDRSRYGDPDSPDYREDAYERATFSFVHGLRDDPENRVTRNDWDVEFGRDTLNVRMVVDDSSLIVDLGFHELADVATVDASAFRSAVARAAVEAFAPENHRKRGSYTRARAILGHTYFVWTQDDDTDEVATFRVVELESKKRCVLDWYATKDGASGRGSFAGTRALAALLDGLRLEARAQHLLAAPFVRLQVRSGASGGNRNRIDMAGNANSYIDRIETAAIDTTSLVPESERPIAYCEGGYVPEGRTFVVTRVTYTGIAHDESKRRGGFRIQLLGKTIAESSASGEPIQGVWLGEVEIEPGDERGTYLEVRKATAIDAIFEGHWKP